MEPGAEIFLKSVRAICPNVTDFELSQFASKLTFNELKKKDLFLRSGKVQKAIGFIANGLVRSSYVGQNGNEITVGFYAEGDYATHYPAFLIQRPSLYAIQCLEPTTMVSNSFEDMQQVYTYKLRDRIIGDRQRRMIIRKDRIPELLDQ